MGNIIGESLDDYVGEQIKLRQKIYGSGTPGNPRSTEQISYLNSRTAWVKFASGTSINEERLALLKPNNPMLVGVVPGFDLAQKNVLFNGLSYLEESWNHEFNNPTDEEFAQGTAPSEKITGEYRLGSRQGINNIDRAYGVGGTDFGFSPMPGIVDVNIKYLNRGSLKKATINIRAFNRNQLDVIDALYMRLGYTVLLEWGNDKYFNNPTQGSPSILNPIGSTLIEKYFFEERNKGKDYSIWLPEIEKERKRKSGNYDAFFGTINNFNWSFENDGSYNIQISAISMGDVMESFKVNVPSSTTINLKEYLDSSTGAANVISEIGDNTEARKLDFLQHIDNWFDTPETVDELENDIFDHDVDESSANAAGYYYWDAWSSGGTEVGFWDTTGEWLFGSEDLYFGPDITGSANLTTADSSQFTVASRYKERTEGKSIYDLEVFEEDDTVNNNHWYFILDAVELWDLVYPSGLDEQKRNYDKAVAEYVTDVVREDEELFEFVQGEVEELKESKLKALLFKITEIASKEKKKGKKISYGVKKSTKHHFYEKGETIKLGQILDYNEDQKEKYVKVGLPPTNPDHGSTSDIISTGISLDDKRGSIAYYMRLGSFLKYLETHILFKILPSETPFMYIDTNIKDNIMYTIPNQLSTDPRICLIQSLNFNKGGDIVCNFWDTLENFNINVNDGINYGQIMNIYINFDHIKEILSSDKKINLFRFLSTLCNDINSSLGNVNNLEPVIDESTNTIKIIEQTPIPGIEEIMKSLNISVPQKPTELEVFGYNGEKSNFIHNIGLKTEITKEYATMITIGATANGYIPGEEATAFSKWNAGIEDRFKPDIGDADTANLLPTKEENFEKTNEAVKKNYVEYQNLHALEIIGLNTTHNNEPTFNLDESKISSNSSVVENFNKYLQASSSLSSKQAESSVGFLPFNLNLNMDGLSGIKIYNQLNINTSFLPSNYPETLKFIVTSVDHKLSGNSWETSLNTLGTNKGRIDGSLITLSSFSSTVSRITSEIPKPPSGESIKTTPSGFDLAVESFNFNTKRKNSRINSLWLHHTAGHRLPDKGVSVVRTFNQRAEEGNKASTHDVIDSKGHVENLVPSIYNAYAQGVKGSKIYYNGRGYSVELMALGYFTSKTSDGKQWKRSDGVKIPLNEAGISVDFNLKKINYKGYPVYQAYTTEQINATVKWIKDNLKKFNIKGWKFDNRTYNQMFPKKGTLSPDALAGKPGVYTHNSVRTDKSDIFPQKELIIALKKSFPPFF